MKRIEFIAPVEAMRGNLSGNQELNYGANGEKAYEQEVGKTTAANNYEPRFVGAKRSFDGLKYFQVRTKSSIGLTVKSKSAMALLAGSSACFLAANKNLLIYDKITAAFLAAKESDASLTLRKWLQGIMYEMLAYKQADVTITSSIGNAVINNPWVGGGEGVDLAISPEIYAKFASELGSPDVGTRFTIDGVQGFANRDETWGEFEGTSADTFGLHIDEDEYVRKDELYLVDPDGNYCSMTDEINPVAYHTTDVAPE